MFLFVEIHQKIIQSKKPMEQEGSTGEGGISKEFGVGKGVKLQPQQFEEEVDEKSAKKKKKKKGCCKSS